MSELDNTYAHFLQTFVKFDNRLFKQELLEEPTPAEKKRNAPQSPRSPQKRHRSDSIDSLATNRASIGDFSDVEERAALLGDPGLEDDPFQIGDGGLLGTELESIRPLPSDELAAAMGAPPSPPMSTKGDRSDHSSSGLKRSSERLADISLDDDAPMTEDTPEMRGPEMQERASPASPFIVRRPNGSIVDKRASILDQAMEIDANLDVLDGNPEDYYK